MLHGMSKDDQEFTKNNSFMHTLKGDKEKGYSTSMDNMYTAFKMPTLDGDAVQAPIFMAISPSATNDVGTYSGQGSLVPERNVAQTILSQPPTKTSILYE